MSLKAGENVVWLKNGLDSDEGPSYSASQSETSCSHYMPLWLWLAS